MGLSTFSSLNIAARGLEASRHQIAITGQNTANVGTAGYSRQSATLLSQPGITGPGLFPGPAGPGQGVMVGGIDRAASEFANRQVRTTMAHSGFQQIRAETFSRIEDVLREPGDNSVSQSINKFFTAWQELSNDPGGKAPSAVLMQEGIALSNRISTDYRSLSNQWASQHQALENDVAQVNELGGRLAYINDTIRQAVANGGNANELKDVRDQIAEQLSTLTGGVLRTNAEGTADFLIGGNALVTADGIQYKLTTSVTDAPGEEVTVSWSHRPGSAGVDGGSIAGRISVLSPDGPLVTSMNAYDDLASTVASQVNALHASGVNAAGVPGGDFFSIDPGNPAASMKMALTNANDIAHAVPGTGALNGDLADQISQVAPDVSRFWSGFVSTTGASSRTALDGLALAVAAEGSARSSQLSISSVDLDEEAVNLVTFQSAYQASARVITAVDEMLDVLINRTGVVGR